MIAVTENRWHVLIFGVVLLAAWLTPFIYEITRDRREQRERGR